MQINFTGHHVDITPALRDLATKKLDKLSRYSDRINRIEVTFGVEKLQQIAEANVHARGSNIFAKSSAEDLYSAIDDLIGKLDKQLIKHKEKDTERR